MTDNARTILDFVPYLRAGECPHALGDSGWCQPCQTQLADLIERLVSLMLMKRRIEDEIRALRAAGQRLPIRSINGEP